MKKFTALYVYINATRAPGAAGVQVEALANWCQANGIKNYRYFADHEADAMDEGEIATDRAAMNRMMAKVRKQKITQVVCFDIEQLANSDLERQLVLELCKNHSVPVVEVIAGGTVQDAINENGVSPELGRNLATVCDAEPLPMANETPVSLEIGGDEKMETPPPSEAKTVGKKRGRKLKRNVLLINELLDAGESLSKIATAAGCSRATVQLQKKLWRAERQLLALEVEPPLQVPDGPPDSASTTEQAPRQRNDTFPVPTRKTRTTANKLYGRSFLKKGATLNA